MVISFSRLHFHPKDAILRRVMSHATDILLGDDILQPQIQKNFLDLEQWLIHRGFEAEADLDAIEEPDDFTNRKRVKELKSVLAESRAREKGKYLKTKMENFTGEELAALLFGLAQLDIPKQSFKFFDFTKEEIMRDAVQLSVWPLTASCMLHEVCSRRLNCRLLCGLSPSMVNWTNDSFSLLWKKLNRTINNATTI